MLNELVKRLNLDANSNDDKSIIQRGAQECSQVPQYESLIKDYSNLDIMNFKNAIKNVSVDMTAPMEVSIENCKNAINNPSKAINEAVYSTDKTITIDKEDYESLLASLKTYNNDDNRTKKHTNETVKRFLKSLNKELRKANDDTPTDAMINVIINKLCRIYNINIEVDADSSNKYIMAKKINEISKNL